MKLVVISPEGVEPRETAVLAELFAAGLERYHVRKPGWSRAALEAWLRALPAAWRCRLSLHQHHELVDTLRLGGVHWQDAAVTHDGREDQGDAVAVKVGGQVPLAAIPGTKFARSGGHGDVPAHPQAAFTSPGEHRKVASRSCHDPATLRASLGRYDSVFFSPVFPSISKPGYGPAGGAALQEVTTVLARRTHAERRTSVLALGGITAATANDALALGFDGVAVLGALWQAPDPIRAFVEIQNALACHAA